MTDGNVAEQQDAGSRPGHPNRSGLVAGAAVGLVACAVVGALGGYLLAGGGGEPPEQQADGRPTATNVRTSSSTPRAVTPSRTPSRRPSTPPPIGQMLLPDVVGMDFEKAREELRSLGLGVQFVFGDAGDGRSVASTNPRGGSPVKRGVTVRVTVAGAPPEVVVPDLVGQSCGQGGRGLVEDGLFPSYRTGRSGQVHRLDPAPGTVRRWNDEVQLYCSDSADPTTTPTP